MAYDLKPYVKHACGIAKRESKINEPWENGELFYVCLEAAIREYVANMSVDHVASIVTGKNYNPIQAACCQETINNGTLKDKLEEYLAHKAVKSLK